MSTRAGIIIKEGADEAHFYRHSDGYPECTMPALELFLKWVKEGKIRHNVMQCAGWLVIIGALEYSTLPKVNIPANGAYEFSDIEAPDNWKCGAFEPISNVSQIGDLEYIYTINLEKKTITYKKL